jgi:hypothetical protein
LTDNKISQVQITLINLLVLQCRLKVSAGSVEQSLIIVVIWKLSISAPWHSVHIKGLSISPPATLAAGGLSVPRHVHIKGLSGGRVPLYKATSQRASCAELQKIRKGNKFPKLPSKIRM